MSVSDREHLLALRDADDRFYAERDRRYTEVADARAEALKIKEAGDALALTLAAENQRLRDEQHNGVLRQWQEDRAHSMSREEIEALLRPLSEFMSGLRASTNSRLDSRSVMFAVLGLLATIALIVSPHIH